MENRRSEQIINENLKGLYQLFSENIRAEVNKYYIRLLEFPYEDIVFFNKFDNQTLTRVIHDKNLRETMPVVVFMNNNAKLTQTLKPNGFIPLTRWKGMAIPKKISNEVIKGLEFVHITSPYRYRQWESVAATVFHSGEIKPKKLPYSRLYKKDNIRFILGLFNKKPACVGALFENKESSGIYFVGTHPEFRGNGLGSALTKHLINIAQRETIVLQATMDGYKIYTKLGFKEFCNFDLYRLMPYEH